MSPSYSLNHLLPGRAARGPEGRGLAVPGEGSPAADPEPQWVSAGAAPIPAGGGAQHQAPEEAQRYETPGWRWVKPSGLFLVLSPPSVMRLKLKYYLSDAFKQLFKMGEPSCSPRLPTGRNWRFESQKLEDGIQTP